LLGCQSLGENSFTEKQSDLVCYDSIQKTIKKLGKSGLAVRLVGIRFGGLDCDCDWQSKIKIVLGIWIVNPVFSFQSKSKKTRIFYQYIKIS